MKVKLHYETNGFGLSGVYFTKETVWDAVGWGGDFKWLVQPLMVTRNNADGHPVAKVKIALDGEFTRWPRSTIDFNPSWTIDGEGNLVRD